jgi:hypothetical protein
VGGGGKGEREGRGRKREGPFLGVAFLGSAKDLGQHMPDAMAYHITNHDIPMTYRIRNHDIPMIYRTRNKYTSLMPWHTKLERNV